MLLLASQLLVAGARRVCYKTVLRNLAAPRYPGLPLTGNTELSSSCRALLLCVQPSAVSPGVPPLAELSRLPHLGAERALVVPGQHGAVGEGAVGFGGHWLWTLPGPVLANCPVVVPEQRCKVWHSRCFCGGSVPVLPPWCLCHLTPGAQG